MLKTPVKITYLLSLHDQPGIKFLLKHPIGAAATLLVTGDRRVGCARTVSSALGLSPFPLPGTLRVFYSGRNFSTDQAMKVAPFLPPFIQ